MKDIKIKKKAVSTEMLVVVTIVIITVILVFSIVMSRFDFYKSIIGG